MAKKMLIDATHEEETRVAVVEGDRLEEYDYESAFRKALKGNIYLAKVTRVEPSLQAAFVNFGGNRHGFLPFSEIHPDYFRIPVADREALMALQEEALKEHDAAEEAAEAEDQDEESTEEVLEDAEDDAVDDVVTLDPENAVGDDVELDAFDDAADDIDFDEEDEDGPNGNIREPEPSEDDDVDGNNTDPVEGGETSENKINNRGRGRGRGGRGRGRGRNMRNRNRDNEVVDNEQDAEQRFRFNLRRKYKIQEVIKRGQIMLVQVSKEERGNKGAAVGTYLSLPGRYCVLMPNSPRAGGVSRKIANYKDRAKMRDMLKQIDVPKGMSVIMRTAGVTRTKAEIKRDLDYLMRLWDRIRELTLESTAPALVYEEADLIKRAVRDLYTRDVESVIVAGDKGFKTAKSFMKMMIPSHARRVEEYDDKIPLFNRYRVENQINEMSSPTATMKSGGYLVINPTEALVSIDVNSGKATKERHIEGTALKTNLEAADEVARQLRLRDLGGLVVVDFIDMENRRNNAKVERRLRDALAGDRARIQVGRISSFGLLELSRQRLNPSLTEAQYETCPHCQGTGNIRTADATSVLVIRGIEDEGIKGRAAELIVHVPTKVALYLLNSKRSHLSELEERYNLNISIRVDDTMAASEFRIEVSKPLEKGVQAGGQNEVQDGEQQDEEKSGSRRRGRRGGRRRRGRRDEEHNEENQNADGVVQDENNAAQREVLQPTEEDVDSSKPKRGRGRKKKSDDDFVVSDAQVDASQDDEKAEKPKRRRSLVKKAKEEIVEDAVDSADNAPKKKSIRRKSSKAEEAGEADASDKDVKAVPTKKKAKASNDDNQEENHASQFETVNEAPSKKKKGWWNKLKD